MDERAHPEETQNKWLKILPFFATYLVAAWTFLQFLDWSLKRYNFSPHWVDIMLWLFVGIMPSLLIYLYHRERINRRIIRRREKIIFPLNVVLLAVVIYFGFGNNDLGATTQAINYTTVKGVSKTALITKEEFRTGFAIFNFEPITKDSAYSWMEFGITQLLDLDLSQNKNISPESYGYSLTADKVNTAKLFYDAYVDGQFEIIDNLYVIRVFIRNSSNAKIITQETFKGNDILNLIDEITVFVTTNFVPVNFNKPDYLDLNVREFTSSSLKAIEFYTKGDYENAIKEDSTFALAYLYDARLNLTYNLSKYEERRLAEKAYQNREKLPLQKQVEALILRNLAWDQYEKAEELVKLQLEIDPSDPTFNEILYKIYSRTKNIKAYADHASKAWKNKHNANNGFQYLNACLIEGDYNKIINELNTLELLELNKNEIFSLKIMPLLLKGDLKSASETQNKIKLTHPDWENLTKVYDKALAYLNNHKVTKEELQKFEGEYRSENSEMSLTFWVENNTLLHYASNQTMFPTLKAGDNTLIAGNAFLGQTFEYSFLKNDDNTIYAVKGEQNYLSGSKTFYWWKINDNIKKAEALLEALKLDSAEMAYNMTIKDNPRHFYLKDALAHINYVKSIDSVFLINQYKSVSGTYGPRIFWIDNGKLFYKRTDNSSLGQVQLLPIAENRYINLTRMNDILEFEYKNGKPITSFAWKFNSEKMDWEKLINKGNSFKRDS